MMESVRLSPPNSLILVMDHLSGELPDAMNGQLVASTNSCVAVGTLSEVDGETVITLTDDLEGLEPGTLVFDGILQTPSGELSVCNVNDEKLLSMLGLTPHAHVRVFANDDSEPDRIVVLARSIPMR